MRLWIRNPLAILAENAQDGIEDGIPGLDLDQLRAHHQAAARRLWARAGLA